jgi:phage protein D
MPEAPLSELSVYSARPTVRLDSKENSRLSELVLAMEMTEREGGLSSLELRVSNIASDPEGGADLAFEDEQLLKLGAKIAIYSGDENGPAEIFQGAITALEGDFREDAPPELVVLAEDAAQQARMSRRTRLHQNVSIADITSGIASQLGLTPVITGFTEQPGVEMQLDESDLAFLRRLLARYDGDVQIVGKEFHVSPRKDVRRGAVELEMHKQLRSARVLADLAHQVTEVTVTGWDVSQGQRITTSSRGANPGPGSGRTGSQMLSDAIGERSEHIGHLAVSTSDEAQALADAAFDLRARRFVCVDGKAEGNAKLRVGAHVTLKGMSKRFDNTYYVVHACHRWDLTHGYETDFTAECAYFGAA